jgi:hypothetical protein
MSTLRCLVLVAALIVGGFAFTAPARAAATYNVLFDDSSAETAGNADWIISTAMPDPLARSATRPTR